MLPKLRLRATTCCLKLIPLLLLYNIKSANAQICYDTDGSVMIGDLACQPHLKNSFCCGASWTCMSPGICSRENTTEATHSGGSLLFRASCTDPTWASDACPNFCLKDKNHKGQRIRGMKDLDGNHKTFCCVVSNCDDSVADNRTVLTNNPGVVTLDQEAKPFTTIGLLGPTGGSISPDPVLTVTASQTATSTIVSAGPATAAGDSQAANSSKRSSTIGIAVGVIGGIVILLLAAFLVLWRRRRRSGDSKPQHLIVNNTDEPQRRPEDLSDVGFPPRELYNRDKHMEPEMPAEEHTSPTSRQELSAGVHIVPELAHTTYKDV